MCDLKIDEIVGGQEIRLNESSTLLEHQKGKLGLNRQSCFDGSVECNINWLLQRNSVVYKIFLRCGKKCLKVACFDVSDYLISVSFIYLSLFKCFRDLMLTYPSSFQLDTLFSYCEGVSHLNL